MIGHPEIRSDNPSVLLRFSLAFWICLPSDFPVLTLLLFSTTTLTLFFCLCLLNIDLGPFDYPPAKVPQPF